VRSDKKQQTEAVLDEVFKAGDKNVGWWLLVKRKRWDYWPEGCD